MFNIHNCQEHLFYSVKLHLLEDNLNYLSKLLTNQTKFLEIVLLKILKTQNMKKFMKNMRYIYKYY